jgi:hypothetical protein
MKLMGILVMVIGLVIRVYGEVSSDISDIVEKTLKDLRYSKADKSMIKEAEKDPRFYTLKEGVKIKVEEIKEEKDIGISEIGLVGKGEKGIVDTLVAIDQIVNIGDMEYGGRKQACCEGRKQVCSCLTYGSKERWRVKWVVEA